MTTEIQGTVSVNLAEMVADLRLLKDKVAALEKTNAALANALERRVKAAIEQADNRMGRELARAGEFLDERTKGVGDAINARFGERMETIELDLSRLESTTTETLRIAADAKAIAEAAAKTADEVGLFSAKLDLLDDKQKRLGPRLDALEQAKAKAQEPAKINRR